MQFNPGDKTGLVDEADDICQSDNNSYPIESKVRRVNSALDRFFTLAFKSDGRWTFNDILLGQDPIYYQDLVTGQQVYDLDNFTTNILNVLRFEVIDSAGNAHTLARLKMENVQSLTDYKTTPGIPEEYDLVGNNVYLYPAPDYDLTDGFKGYFNLPAVRFTSLDTNIEIPVPLIFHEYICRLVALPYLIEFQKPQKNDIAALIAQDEKEVENHFSHREKGQGENMTMAGINFR